MTSEISNKPTLTNEQAAQYLGVSPASLITWRCTKRYRIPFYRVGRCIRYKQSDLDKFLESRRVS